MPRTQRLFGGQIVGQALVAAAESVGDHLFAHSLHCYFVRAGKMQHHLGDFVKFRPPHIVFFSPTCIFRRSEGSGPLPGGSYKGRPQFQRALSEGHPTRTAHTHLPSLLPHATGEPPAAPVHHASGPPA